MVARSARQSVWRTPLAEAGLVLAITVGAALLRMAAIDALPPGLYRDEAYNGLDALSVLSGHMPLFFEANNGREPLFIYLVALSVRLWGRSPGALRLVSAWVGTLTIPTIYWLGRELFDRRVAAVAAILAATTVWTLNLSRVAFRAVVMIPLLAIALAFVWRGLRRRRLVLMACGGLFYGLSLYTYLPARIGPLCLLFFIIYTWLWHRQLLRLRGWLSFALLAAVVFAPLATYFAAHRSSLLGRTGEVSILNPAISGGEPWTALGRNVWRTLRGFVYRGDFIPRHNVPLRPVFDPISGAAFVGGLGLAASRARRRPACAMCLIWWGAMLLPTIFLPALGFVEFARWADRRGWARWGSLAVGALLTVSAASNGLAYARHLHSETVYYQFEAGASELAATINRFLGSGWPGIGLAAKERPPLPGRQVYIAGRLWRDWPSVRYLCPESDALHILADEGRLPASLASAPEVLLLLWPYEDHREALALLPRERLIRVREGARERGDLEQESRLLYVSFQTASVDAAPTNAGARWEGDIGLLGYALRPNNDAALQVTLYWQAKQTVERDYTVFCHVLRDGQLIGQCDGPPAGGYYPTSLWRAGDRIEDRRTAALSRPYNRETCEVLVGWYRWENMARLALLDELGQPTQETALRLR